ncbi:hypothetical protein MLD38_007948 [Melastoma candidum]|uniref:Uncharacterized protein n=1 Tax=Melastoma candidum TaxID=119954 RepID=A0ACB9RRX4_9MYRT|nr:hypothetical protein MLD38_007948 [Melastoma candidum]
MEIDAKEKSTREVRRRKIVDRGSDRIALITGRAPNFPSPPQQPHSSPVSDGDNREFDHFKGHFEGEGVTGLLRNDNFVASPERSEEIHEEDQSRAIVLDKSHQKPVKRLQPRPPPTFFSSKRLNQCILESEIMRALSALAIAFVVVFSNVSGKSGGFVSSRPLYLLFLTDATIVGVRMHFHLQRSLAEVTEEEEDGKLPQDDSQNWDGAVKLLERGLVAYQMVRGVFIDCSVYMVIVMCGLCLL